MTHALPTSQQLGNTTSPAPLTVPASSLTRHTLPAPVHLADLEPNNTSATPVGSVEIDTRPITPLVKLITIKVTDEFRHFRTPDAASPPSTRRTPTSLAGGPHLAQGNPVFVRAHATGRRPGSFHIKSSHRTISHPHHPTASFPQGANPILFQLQLQLPPTHPTSLRPRASIKSRPGPPNSSPAHPCLFQAQHKSHRLYLIQHQLNPAVT